MLCYGLCVGFEIQNKFDFILQTIQGIKFNRKCRRRRRQNGEKKQWWHVLWAILIWINIHKFETVVRTVKRLAFGVRRSGMLFVSCWENFIQWRGTAAFMKHNKFNKCLYEDPKEKIANIWSEWKWKLNCENKPHRCPMQIFQFYSVHGPLGQTLHLKWMKHLKKLFCFLFILLGSPFFIFFQSDKRSEFWTFSSFYLRTRFLHGIN